MGCVSIVDVSLSVKRNSVELTKMAVDVFIFVVSFVPVWNPLPCTLITVPPDTFRHRERRPL